MFSLTSRKLSCYYKLLRVDRQADHAAIKQAYYSLAREFHPDSKGNSEHFQKIIEAYHTLIDEDKRYLYDIGQGHINAMDIDRMETLQEQHGTKYPPVHLWKGFQKWDSEMAEALDRDSWVLLKYFYSLFPHRKASSQSSSGLRDPRIFRLLSFLSFTVGTALTYTLTLSLIEYFLLFN